MPSLLAKFLNLLILNPHRKFFPAPGIFLHQHR